MSYTFSKWQYILSHRPADDDCIEWMIDFMGFFPIYIIIYTVIIVGFFCWVWYHDRSYRKLMEE